jgi:hypothetical protein
LTLAGMFSPNENQVEKFLGWYIERMAEGARPN